MVTSYDLSKINIKIFADGADSFKIRGLANNPLVKGFTTNPTLMRASGVRDYVKFAKSLLEDIPDKPISFEVFADDVAEIDRQAREISSWGDNVYVKVPITNTKRHFLGSLFRSLSDDGIKLNVTAVFTLEQVEQTIEALSDSTPSIISVFAGRLADIGIPPDDHMANCAAMLDGKDNIELLWASPRQSYDIILAALCGCHIITITPAMLEKVSLFGKDPKDYSLETVQMFHSDAFMSGYKI